MTSTVASCGSANSTAAAKMSINTKLITWRIIAHEGYYQIIHCTYLVQVRSVRLRQHRFGTHICPSSGVFLLHAALVVDVLWLNVCNSFIFDVLLSDSSSIKCGIPLLSNNNVIITVRLFNRKPNSKLFAGCGFPSRSHCNLRNWLVEETWLLASVECGWGSYIVGDFPTCSACQVWRWYFPYLLPLTMPASWICFSACTHFYCALVLNISSYHVFIHLNSCLAYTFQCLQAHWQLFIFFI